jgi:hypothetical protein
MDCCFTFVLDLIGAILCLAEISKATQPIDNSSQPTNDTKSSENAE